MVESSRVNGPGTLHAAALDRYCAQALAGIAPLAVDLPEGQAHARYLEVWKRLGLFDKEIVAKLNNLPRSQAYFVVTALHAERFITGQDLAGYRGKSRYPKSLWVLDRLAEPFLACSAAMSCQRIWPPRSAM